MHREKPIEKHSRARIWWTGRACRQFKLKFMSSPLRAYSISQEASFDFPKLLFQGISQNSFVAFDTSFDVFNFHKTASFDRVEYFEAIPA